MKNFLKRFLSRFADSYLEWLIRIKEGRLEQLNDYYCYMQYLNVKYYGSKQLDAMFNKEDRENAPSLFWNYYFEKLRHNKYIMNYDQTRTKTQTL